MAAHRLACVSHKSELLLLTLQLAVLLQGEIWNRSGADGATGAESANASLPALHVMFLTAKSEFFDSSGVAPAVSLAEKHINCRHDLLPGHRLHVGTAGDSKVRGNPLQLYIKHIIQCMVWCQSVLKGTIQLTCVPPAGFMC